MKHNVLKLLILILISGFVGYYVGVSKINLDWNNYKPSLQISSKEPPSQIQNVDFSLFWTVWQKLEATYYDKTKLNPQQMLNGAIDGMVQSLGDPFTVYLPPAQNTNFKEGLAGQFSGIGAELGMKDKQVIVMAPLDGSPAKKAGIKAGDAILKVDNVSTFGWSLSQAVDKIRGPRGTKVTLGILHKDSPKSQDIAIVRDTITIKSVTGGIKTIKYPAKGGQAKVNQEVEITDEKCDECQKIVYIRLSQFGDATNQDWIALANKLDLEIKTERKVKGLILDLRNNPGGYLTDAVFISSEFLKQGAVVVGQDNGQRVSNLSVTRKGLFYDIPLVVLINKGTASAGEIVAGALRDHKRATLLGETSFGKGTIQQAEDLGNGAGIHVTIAKWLTPNGTWVNGTGLKPDIESSVGDVTDASQDTQLEKAVLQLVK